jgi:hypothetical protein
MVAAVVAGIARADPLESPERGFKRRLADLEAADPLQPRAFDERRAYAKHLMDTVGADCELSLSAAEKLLEPALTVSSADLLAQPRTLPDAMGLLQSIQYKRGLCVEDPMAAEAALRASIATGERAVELFRAIWDYPEMIVARFNVAMAKHESGDVDGALRDLEQVLALNLEFGLLDDWKSDYATLLRWRARGAEPDAELVEREAKRHVGRVARLRYVSEPHRYRSRVVAERRRAVGNRVTTVTATVRVQGQAVRTGADLVLSETPLSEAQLKVDVDGGPAPVDAAMQAMFGNMLSGAQPEIVVGPDGQFKSVRNLSEVRRGMLGSMGRPAAVDGASRADPRDAVDRLLSDELLTAQIRANWDLAVANWIGADLEHSAQYELDSTDPVPGLGDRPLRRMTRFLVARWLPCAPASRRECVELLMSISFEPQDLKGVVDAMVDRALASNDPESSTTRGAIIEQTTLVRVITEPSTLRTWEYEQRRYTFISEPSAGKISRRQDSARTLIQQDD